MEERSIDLGNILDNDNLFIILLNIKSLYSISIIIKYFLSSLKILRLSSSTILRHFSTIKFKTKNIRYYI